MHGAAYRYVQQALGRIPEPRRVVEIGARVINGSVRDLFAAAARSGAYLATDLLPGPGVDVVADGATFTPPFAPEVVVCCETLEHAADPAAIVANAHRMLAPGGHLILTAATDPRVPHSGIDGGPHLGEGETYANVGPVRLVGWLAPFEDVDVEIDTTVGDIRAIARKAPAEIAAAAAGEAESPARAVAA